MLETNKQKLVIQSVCGNIHHPTKKGEGYYTGFDGRGRVLVSTGGITYNYAIGDGCMLDCGDHIEPGVSIQNPNPNENNALMNLACVGNMARVISGEAKGKTGIVTGKHGGVDHVMVHFDSDTLDLMVPNDSLLIKSCGVGLKIKDFDDVYCMNMDPSLLDKMNITKKANQLEIGVTHIIPACLMGSGLGSTSLMNCDYDIMCNDPEMIKTYHLDTLRFGDIVFIQDHCAINGAYYELGSGVIGVICHSSSFSAGHGPGVTVLMSARNNQLVPIVDAKANLKYFYE